MSPAWQRVATREYVGGLPKRERKMLRGHDRAPLASIASRTPTFKTLPSCWIGASQHYEIKEHHIRPWEHEGIFESVQRLLDDDPRIRSALPLAGSLAFTYPGREFAPAAKRGW